MAAVGAASAIVVACSTFGADGDGVPTSDAGVDRASAEPDTEEQGDAGPSQTCADAGFDFCDDFERDTVRGLWRSPYIAADSGSALSITKDTSVSPSRSLAATIPAGSAYNPAVYLSRKLAATTRKVRVSFSLRSEEIGADVQVVNITFANMTYIILTLAKDGDGQSVLRATEQRQYVDGGPDFGRTQVVTLVPLHVWVRFNISVDVASKKVTVSRDDNAPVESFPPLALDYGATDSLKVGAAYVASPRAAARTIGFDDVFYAED